MTDSSLAQIVAVPRAHAGKVLTDGNAFHMNALHIGQLVLFGSAALAPTAIGGLATHFLGDNLFLVGGFVLTGLVIWALHGMLANDPWGTNFMFNKTQEEFRKRTDRLVDPDNPEAIFVQVIPRRNWDTNSFNKASDQGFLLIDLENRQLIFEGDRERYRIPASALLSYDVEKASSDPESTTVGVVVLICQDATDELEIPLMAHRTVAGDILGAEHMDRAYALRKRVDKLLG